MKKNNSPGLLGGSSGLLGGALLGGGGGGLLGGNGGLLGGSGGLLGGGLLGGLGGIINCPLTSVLTSHLSALTSRCIQATQSGICLNECVQALDMVTQDFYGCSILGINLGIIPSILHSATVPLALGICIPNVLQPVCQLTDSLIRRANLALNIAVDVCAGLTLGAVGDQVSCGACVRAAAVVTRTEGICSGLLLPSRVNATALAAIDAAVSAQCTGWGGQCLLGVEAKAYLAARASLGTVCADTLHGVCTAACANLVAQVRANAVACVDDFIITAQEDAALALATSVCV